mgnify:CR=1 FL=1
MRRLLPTSLCALLVSGAAASPASVTIHNRTTDVLRGVYLSPATEDSWGPDRASENVHIKGRLTIALPGPGCHWDVRVLLGNRPAEQLFRNRDLCRSPLVTVDGRTRRFDRGRDAPRWN